MTKKLLIDASHAEETRVVVLDGNRLEDFDVETATRKQIKGNIYLAKVIRVEPSLQAAFVEYGGNRHGFLAFGEIHPDYYQIPVADRQRLLAEQAEAAEEAEDEAEEDAPSAPKPEPDSGQTITAPLEARPIEIRSAAPPGEADEAETDAAGSSTVASGEADPAETEPAQTDIEYMQAAAPEAEETERLADQPEDDAPALEAPAEDGSDQPAASEADAFPEDAVTEIDQPAEPPPESLGGEGDDAAEARERRQRQRYLRNYKIQEVIHRRQIMLIQVVKEERGNKGAALTTYLSLAGRFSVLMPNSPTGGGVSRKITSVADRRRLKEAMKELDIPSGMGLIVRTAGANRPKPEITRDCEYLLRLWDDIREKTMQSTAPALIYEEASLIKRTIRDVYTRDVEEVMVDGEEGFTAARDFMRMLMPSHARKVQLWTEGQPLFARYQVENQLDAMLNPVVQLRSGGYIVINQTEALVAIDVNSGRSTRERSIEDTAVRTNLEAADEVARQLRMRDLAGLIVIDFIDMEVRRNNASVERRMKEALKNDRARIQLGAISHFGLMEMSRQRLRPSLAEASLMLCPHCGGMGHVRSPDSAALHILRAIEDEGAKFRAAEILVHLPPEIALYLFNHKRDRLAAIEARYAMRVTFNGDATLTAANFRIDKVRAQIAVPPASPSAPSAPPPRQAPEPSYATDEQEAEEDETEPAEGDAAADGPTAPGEPAGEDADRKRRRRRRRGKRRPENGEAGPQPAGAAPGEGAPAATEEPDEAQPPSFDQVLDAELGDPETQSARAADTSGRRRRGLGGRRRRGQDGGDTGADESPAETTTPVYADLADIFEAAERAEASARTPQPAPEQPGQALDEALDTVAAVTGTPEPASGPAPAPEAEPTLFEPAPEEALPEPEEVLPEEAVPEEAAPAEPMSAAAEVLVPEPAFRPTIIGQGAPALEKKQGWWRR